MLGKSICWVVVLLLVGVLSSLSIASTPKVYFPLMAWDYVDDEPTLQKMADCGITAVAFMRPKLLDACAKRGMKGIIIDEGVAPAFGELFNGDKACAALPELIAKYGKHPALYGYHLRDEPGADQFPALGRAADLIRKQNPGAWPYVCNYPGTGDDYVKLLEDFVAKVNPTIMTYDNYASREDGSFSWGFWANMADVRKVAVRHNLPFQTIVLTATHWSYGNVTQANLRLEVFGSLAYGAQGIAYYKFLSGSLPILNCPDLGNFREGPLDEFGEKTETWYWLRNVNRQVQHLAPTLLKLRTDDVYHFGEVPQRNHGPNDKTLVKAMPDGVDWIVGDFTHEDGSRYVLIVNKSLEHSRMCIPEFNTQPKTLQYVSPVTGELKPYPNPYYALAPGQGVLLRLAP